MLESENIINYLNIKLKVPAQNTNLNLLQNTTQ